MISISASASATFPLQTAFFTLNLGRRSTNFTRSSFLFVLSPWPSLASAATSSPDQISRFCRMNCIRRMSGGCFKDPAGKNLKVEADSGGEDFFASAPRTPPEHLVIMVNGLIGRFL